MNRPTRFTLFGIVVVLVAAVWVNFARAAFDNGNELLHNCTIRGEFAGGLCYGLITGYYDGMRLSYTCAKDDPKINRQQIRDIVVKFLGDHPEARHLPAIYLAARAFVEAFDCHPNK
jgi:uncharacterized protein YneF (UPF0154 family)